MEKLTEKQLYFLKWYCSGEWIQTEKGIHLYGSVVAGGSILKSLGVDKIPVKFYRVEYNFNCYGNNLTCLENCPEYVGIYFSCFSNNLTSLEGCPKYVGNDFECFNNKLTNLEGIEKVKGRIYCFGNKINYKREKELRPEIYNKIGCLSTLEKMLVEI